MKTKVLLTCRNPNIPECGKHFTYDSVLDYAISERAAFDELASEILKKDVELSDSQIAKAVEIAYEINVTSFYDGADMIGNQWKNESVIDFDNPISKGEDVSQSMYFALLIGWEKAT